MGLREPRYSREEFDRRGQDIYERDEIPSYSCRAAHGNRLGGGIRPAMRQ